MKFFVSCSSGILVLLFSDIFCVEIFEKGKEGLNIRELGLESPGIEIGQVENIAQVLNLANKFDKSFLPVLLLSHSDQGPPQVLPVPLTCWSQGLSCWWKGEIALQSEQRRQ